MKNVAKPPRISLPGVEPRWLIWKKLSIAPRAPEGFLEVEAVAVGGMALSVGRRPDYSAHPGQVKECGRQGAHIPSACRWTHRLCWVSPEEPKPIAIDTTKVIEIGIALWGIALVVSLLVPSLHLGERHWWPWACVAGLVGGGLASWYVRRGKGNAAAAIRSHRT